MLLTLEGYSDITEIINWIKSLLAELDKVTQQFPMTSCDESDSSKDMVNPF